MLFWLSVQEEITSPADSHFVDLTGSWSTIHGKSSVDFSSNIEIFLFQSKYFSFLIAILYSPISKDLLFGVLPEDCSFIYRVAEDGSDLIVKTPVFIISLSSILILYPFEKKYMKKDTPSISTTEKIGKMTVIIFVVGFSDEVFI